MRPFPWRPFALAAGAAFVVLFVVPLALHLGIFVAQTFTGLDAMPEVGLLIGSNALWAAAWTLIGLLPLSYGLRRWAPSWTRRWAPVLGLAAVAFVVACARLAPTAVGAADLLRWAVPEAVLVVLGFFVFEAVLATRLCDATG
jgi:hypothetical protein